MKKLVRYLLLFTALFFSASLIFGQENYATNIKTEISGTEKMLITYDIDGKGGGVFFNVIILLTSNGQQIKANSAYGDYGSKISPGIEKAIVWYFNNDFKGDIQKVEVDVFAYKENEPQAVFRIQSVGNNGYAPCEVVFINNSTDANEYKWDFGDPSSGIKNHSFDKEPTHIYEKKGLYSVSMVAANTDLDMESTFYYSLEILEHPPTIAKFEYSTTNIEAPFDVSFTENSTNADSFSWDFGDPGSGRKNASTVLNPKHKYKQAGTYTVNLKVTNSTTGLSNTVSKELVFKEPELPAANFIFTLSSEIAPSIVIFKNTSLNSDSYTWDFGDMGSGSNNTSAQANPSHTFTEAGKYEVKMTARNTQTGKSTYFSQIVEIAAPPKPPIARFDIENNNIIAPATIIFSNTSNYADRYTWDFGDPGSGNGNASNITNPTHTYTKAGRYEITLTSFSTSADKSDKFSDFVIVTEPAKPPVAGFTVEGNDQTAPSRVNFRNTSSNAERFAWDFGDPDSGSENTSTLTSPSHTYSKGGRYEVILVSSNTDTDETSTHSEFVTVTEPIILPVADFTWDAGEAVSPAVVTFTNSSSKADSFTWNFGDPGSGDGNTSTGTNPTHTYEKDGRYEVVLSALNQSSGVVSKATKSITIAKPISPPVADFTLTFIGDVAPVEISFTNSSLNGDEYRWDFGDTGSGSNESTEANPSHRYTNPGNYTVSLTVKNSTTGKTDVTTRDIKVVSEYTTFVHVSGREGQDEIATSIVSYGDDEYLVLINNPESGSSLITINEEGVISGEKELDGQIMDIDFGAEGQGYVLSGFLEPDKLLIQTMSVTLETEEPVQTDGITIISRDFSLPKLAVAGNGEVGIVGNHVESGDPRDFWFQKLDIEGSLVPVKGKTFKFMGIKLVNEIIASEDDGFAITGYWQEDESKPKRLMFASVDSTGRGFLKAITAVTNFIGCDIVSSHTGGYGILSAQGSPLNDSVYNVVLMIVGLDGGPISFSGSLHENLFLTDMQKFPPSIIRTDGGFVVASYAHNGTDYDINLFWIDVSGEMIMKKEIIQRPGDQFVSDIIELEDGSFIIIGAERIKNQYDALILKTDPFGRVNPVVGSK